MKLPARFAILAAAIPLASGCGAGLHEIRHHPKEAHLETEVQRLIQSGSHPDVHYWVRVSEPGKHTVGLGVLFQRHIYVSSTLVERADAGVLAAVLLHGIAHHRLHHLGQRSGVLTLQQVAFKVGGSFVPGLSYGKYAADPLSEVAMGSWQEPAADAKTVEYLREQGYSGSEWLRALEFFAEHGYAERVGRVTLRGGDFTGRIERLRQTLSDPKPNNASVEESR